MGKNKNIDEIIKTDNNIEKDTTKEFIKAQKDVAKRNTYQAKLIMSGALSGPVILFTVQENIPELYHSSINLTVDTM